MISDLPSVSLSSFLMRLRRTHSPFSHFSCLAHLLKLPPQGTLALSSFKEIDDIIGKFWQEKRIRLVYSSSTKEAWTLNIPNNFLLNSKRNKKKSKNSVIWLKYLQHNMILATRSAWLSWQFRQNILWNQKEYFFNLFEDM